MTAPKRRNHGRRPVPTAAMLLLSLLLIRSALAETTIERGSYLVEAIAGCGGCHTPRTSETAATDSAFSGGFVIAAPAFRAVGPNITPDPETGIGKWSDNDLVAAFRNGRRPDGTIIGPPMQIRAYRNISDSDLRAIVAYLRQLKPVRHRVERSTYDMPLPSTYGPPVGSVPDVDRSDKVAYGRYLAATVGDCANCHTPNQNGRPDLTRLGAGGREMAVEGGGFVVTPNLTPANADGIIGWTDAQVKTLIREGIRPDGSTLAKLMPIDVYRNLSNGDVDAIVAFVRSLKPAT